MKNSMKAFQRGFTLIELMVVIAIIAILSGILLANFAAARSRSRDGQRISDISQIQLALAGYFNQCNEYPIPDTTSGTSTIDSATLTQSTGCPTIVTFSTFISKIPTPPTGTTQTNYSYVVGYLPSDTGHTTPVDFVLEATLENNTSVSSESLSSFPVSSASITFPNALTCDSGIHYCVGSK